MNFDPRRRLKPYRAWLDVTRSWSDGALGSQRVLARTVRRSAEETRAVLDAAHAAGGTPDLANLVRLTGLSRSRWFLWASARLTAAEISVRSFGTCPGALPTAYSPRALVLATVAADLYLGYAALRGRSRRFPGLAAEED
jgi:hypothetical protein